MSRTNRPQTPHAYKTTALAKEGTIYNAANGLLVGIGAVNNSGAVRFLQVHDATADPGGAAVPIVSIALAIGASVSLSFGPGLDLFTTTGIYWTCSTTAAVNTKSATNDLLVWAQYYKPAK